MRFAAADPAGTDAARAGSAPAATDVWGVPPWNGACSPAGRSHERTLTTPLAIATEGASRAETASGDDRKGLKISKLTTSGRHEDDRDDDKTS